MDANLDLDKIRQTIQATGLKMRFVADKVGVSPSTLSSFLTGKRALGRAALQSLLRELNLSEDSVKKKAS